MTGQTAPARRRARRIGWLLPLVAAPVIFFGGTLLAGVLGQGGAPEVLWRVPWALAIVGALASLVVFFVQAVRALSPGGGRTLTPEEEAGHLAGVGLRGGETPPPPTRGLLVFAIVLSVVSIGVVVLSAANLPHTLGLVPEPAVEWGPASSGVWLIVAVVATPVTWRSYAAAQRARRQYAERSVAGGRPPLEHPVPTGRRHRTWVLPLLAIPSIILAAVLIIIALRSVGAPGSAIRTVSVSMLVGIAVAVVVLVVAVTRFLRTPRVTPAAPVDVAPVDGVPSVPPPAGFYESQASADAARRGLAPEEYGVYKGDVGSVVPPVNSAGGLLFLALLLTALNAFLLGLVGVMIAQAVAGVPPNPDDTPLSPVQWGFFVLELMTVPVAWRYYIVERRAQKLRVSRGLPKTLR